MQDKRPKHVQAIANAASRWREPDYEPRRQAVEATLEAPNRWTEQALAHVLNRRMQSLTTDALERWLSGIQVRPDATVGIIQGSDGPLDGLRMYVAAWGLGHRTVGTVPSSSPYLMRALAEDWMDRASDAEIAVGDESVEDEDDVLDVADVLLARVDSAEAAASLRTRCEALGLSEPQRLVQPPVYSAAILDGQESDGERERLAEDMLLLEGSGRRRVAVLWAPRDHPPDPYLQSMARFRGVYPAHPDTPGTLQMQQAFMEARDQPHAYAEGLSFLVSRGDPAPQKAGHIRWTEYDDRSEATAWAGHQSDLYALVARPGLHDQVNADFPLRTPGGIHVPPLDDPDGTAIANTLDAPGSS